MFKNDTFDEFFNSKHNVKIVEYLNGYIPVDKTIAYSCANIISSIVTSIGDTLRCRFLCSVIVDDYLSLDNNCFRTEILYIDLLVHPDSFKVIHFV